MMATNDYALQYRMYLRLTAWRRLRKRYPEFKRCPRLLALLLYLMNGPTDPDTGNRPLSAVIISRLYRNDNTIDRDSHINIAKDVMRLAELTGCTIRYTGYDKKNKRAREVWNFVLSPEVSALIFEEDTPMAWREGMVNLITGKLITPKERSEWWARRLAQADAKNAQCGHEEGRIWLDYMNHCVTPEMLRPGLENVLQAEHYINSLVDDEERQYAHRALESILILPHMPYEWSERSLRLFGKGYNPQNITGEIRQLLWPDLYELDLSSCQLAIFAEVCDVPEVKAFLKSGQKIWPYLAAYCGVPLTKATKAVLKIVLYQVIFGAEKHTLFWEMPGRSLTAAQLRPFTEDVQKRFLAIPEIAALLAARKRVLKAITEAGGRVDAYNEWIPTVTVGPKDKRVNARSVLAQVIQSWEFRLLAPFRELTLSDGRGVHGWRCLIWSHDGASIRIKQRGDAKDIIAKLTKAVNDYAASFGIMTGLEIKRVS